MSKLLDITLQSDIIIAEVQSQKKEEKMDWQNLLKEITKRYTNLFSLVFEGTNYVVFRYNREDLCPFCDWQGNRIKEYIRSKPGKKLILLIGCGGNCWSHEGEIGDSIRKGEKREWQTFMTPEEVQQYFYLGYYHQGHETLLLNYKFQSKNGSFGGATALLGRFKKKKEEFDKKQREQNTTRAAKI